MTEQIEVADITRRNGAYIVWLGTGVDGWADATPQDMVDVAGSMRRAKQVAKELAEGWGCHGPWRWEQTGGLRTLLMGYNEEEES